MTKQEMFDKAVRGLRSQGFEKCYLPGTGCVYASADGTKHCAWGWVDEGLDYLKRGGVESLKRRGFGIAANLTDDDLHFAEQLQGAHDDANGPVHMQELLQRVAKEFGLTWPEE